MNNTFDPSGLATPADEYWDWLLTNYDIEDAVENEEGIHAYGTMPNTNETGWFFVGTWKEIDAARSGH